MTRITRRAALAGLATAPLARPGIVRSQSSSQPVKIGFVSDMSGPYRDNGGPGTKVAAEMAVADFGGSVLGRPVQILQADGQNKPNVAAAIARQWIDDNGVDAVADGAATSSGLGVQQISHEKKRIYLITDPAATDFIGKQCSPYGFQFVYDTYALAKGTGLGLTKAGGDSWYFITADYEFGYSLQQNTETFVKQAGGKVLGSVRAPLGTADFSSYLLQAKTSRAKVIGLANAGTDLQNCLKQAGAYAAVLYYLKAVKAAGTLDSDTVAAKIRAMPVNDFYNANVTIDPDGCVRHTMHIWQVKSPGESKGKWDFYKAVGVMRGAQAFPPPGLFGCPLVHA